MSDQVLTGHVRWFKPRRGYGFINCEDIVNEDGTCRDIFVHWSKITMDGYRTLNANQQVSFKLTWSEEGNPQAFEVVPLDADK